MSEPTPTPDAAGYGFRMASATVAVSPYYEIFGNRVVLGAWIYVAGAPPAQWRRFETPRESAIDQAIELCLDIEEYLVDGLNQVPRPVEDLDLDDFIDHLEMRLTNAMH